MIDRGGGSVVALQGSLKGADHGIIRDVKIRPAIEIEIAPRQAGGKARMVESEGAGGVVKDNGPVIIHGEVENKVAAWVSVAGWVQPIIGPKRRRGFRRRGAGG